MAGVYTALGTANSVSAGTTLTLPSVTVPTGAVLVVSIGLVSVVRTVSSVTFGGQSLFALGASATSLASSEIWTLDNVTGNTATITVTFSGSVTKKALAAGYMLGTSGAGYDTNVLEFGSGTAPDSTSDNLGGGMVGVVFTNGPVEDAAGSWTQSVTGVQRGGTTGGIGNTNITVSDGYKFTAGTTTLSAGKTGITSRDWMALG